MAAPQRGRFVWHELHTTDRARAMKFYADLVGWETKEVPMGPGEPYGLVMRDGKDFAGITKSMAPAGVPSYWLPYLGVEDVDERAKRAGELGGKVVMPPMDIPEVGRFAVIADPQGATFALYRHSRPDDPEPVRPAGGSFCWNELMTNDPKAAASFYADLFGYEVQEMNMGPDKTYRVLKRGDRMTAGIMDAPPGVPPNWLTYIAVGDVDASTKKAEGLGAKTMMPPTDIPNMGRFSVLEDPTGAAIALFNGA